MWGENERRKKSISLWKPQCDTFCPCNLPCPCCHRMDEYREAALGLLTHTSTNRIGSVVLPRGRFRAQKA